jgi:hypothetical protein
MNVRTPAEAGMLHQEDEDLFSTALPAAGKIKRFLDLPKPYPPNKCAIASNP